MRTICLWLDDVIFGAATNARVHTGWCGVTYCGAHPGLGVRGGDDRDIRDMGTGKAPHFGPTIGALLDKEGYVFRFR